MSNTRLMIRRKLGRLYRSLFFRPPGVDMGAGASVRRPWVIEGAPYIQIGVNSVIREDAYIAAYDRWKEQRFNPKIRIGKDVYIGRHVFMTSINGITVGDGCVFSDYVYLTDSYHGMHPDHGLIMEQRWETKGPVNVGEHCFVGFRACIMPGVTLGPRCIVGANSVVTRSFNGYVMLGGAPARVLKVYSQKVKDWVLPDRADE